MGKGKGAGKPASQKPSSRSDKDSMFSGMKRAAKEMRGDSKKGK